MEWHCKAQRLLEELKTMMMMMKTEDCKTILHAQRLKEGEEELQNKKPAGFLFLFLSTLSSSYKHQRRRPRGLFEVRTSQGKIFLRFSMLPCYLYCMYCSMTGMLQDDPMPDIVSGGWLYSMCIELRMAVMHTARVLWVLTLKEN